MADIYGRTNVRGIPDRYHGTMRAIGNNNKVSLGEVYNIALKRLLDLLDNSDLVLMEPDDFQTPNTNRPITGIDTDLHDAIAGHAYKQTVSVKFAYHVALEDLFEDIENGNVPELPIGPASHRVAARSNGAATHVNGRGH